MTDIRPEPSLRHREEREDDAANVECMSDEPAPKGEKVSAVDDISISFNCVEYNRHEVALEVQNAVNLRALAREFVKVVDQAAEESKSTSATWADPAVVPFVSKFESLCGSTGKFSEADAVCRDSELKAISRSKGAMMTDHEAMLAIRDLMDGVEWNSDTLEAIAEVITEAGYQIRDMNNIRRDQRGG